MSNAIDIRKRTKGEWMVNNCETANSVGCQIDAVSNLYAKQTICTLMHEDHEANAAFIVTACNNYDKLVEALKSFLKVINRSNATQHHYGDAINNAEQLLQSIEQDI